MAGNDRGSCQTDDEKIELLSLVLTNNILFTKTPSRRNLTGFQPDLDCVPDVKFESPKPKKGDIRNCRSIIAQIRKAKTLIFELFKMIPLIGYFPTISKG